MLVSNCKRPIWSHKIATVSTAARHEVLFWITIAWMAQSTMMRWHILDPFHWLKSWIAHALYEAKEVRTCCRKFLMLIQEKQFFHQQQLWTCANNMFLYTDLHSVHAQHVVWSLGVEDTRREVHGGSLKGMGIFLQILFLMETYFSEKMIQIWESFSVWV